MGQEVCRHPWRRVQGICSPHHRRQRQAGLPHEAGYPDQRQGEAAVEEGNHLLPSPQGWRAKEEVCRGCIVDGNLSVLSMAIIKKGEAEIPGLTDNTIPRRLGPKRASKIRKLFNLTKEDDVCQYVIKRP